MVAFLRTADLYHVKADWPHQDTRGLFKTSEGIVVRQVRRVTDADTAFIACPNLGLLTF
jgi:hypothetical protein